MELERPAYSASNSASGLLAVDRLRAVNSPLLVQIGGNINLDSDQSRCINIRTELRPSPAEPIPSGPPLLEQQSLAPN